MCRRIRPLETNREKNKKTKQVMIRYVVLFVVMVYWGLEMRAVS